MLSAACAETAERNSSPSKIAETCRPFPALDLICREIWERIYRIEPESRTRLRQQRCASERIGSTFRSHDSRRARAQFFWKFFVKIFLIRFQK